MRVIKSDNDKILHDTVHLRNYSELSHTYVISASLTTPTVSYYPLQIESELTPDPLTRKVVGRNARQNTNAEIKIMCTSTLCPRHCLQFNRNHFVPLMKINKDNAPISVDVNDNETFDQSINDNHKESPIHDSSYKSEDLLVESSIDDEQHETVH